MSHRCPFSAPAGVAAAKTAQPCDTATLRVDLNFDGDTGDEGESAPLTLIPVPHTPGHWTFAHTIPPVPDDGPSHLPWPSNETTFDSLAVEVQVADDDLGAGSTSQHVTVHNVAPRFDGPLMVEYEFYELGELHPELAYGEGALLKSVTVSGAFTDPGAADHHVVQIDWGPGGPHSNSYEHLAPGQYRFSVTRHFPDGWADLGGLFPITAVVHDDDLGYDVLQKALSCADRDPTAPPITGIQYLPGRGTFPMVKLVHHAPTDGVDDGYSGAELRLWWDANKPAFIGKGVCEIGVIQISRVHQVNDGALGGLTGLINSHDWRVDGPVPYALPDGSYSNTRPTADDPFSLGRLSSEDNPGFQKGNLLSQLLHGSMDFETCVVALEGAEGVELRDPVTIVKKMAVYGCIAWGYQTVRQADDTYAVTRWVMNEVTGDEDVDLLVRSGGGGPSEEFRAAIASFFALAAYPPLFFP